MKNEETEMLTGELLEEEAEMSLTQLCRACKLSEAEIVNLVQGVRDQWFRPVDVCTAPDGSLLVQPTERQDSSMFATLARAGCLILRQPHAPALDAGATVQILRFDDAALTI